MNAGSKVVIESRIQLFAALAEASEIEHNLMCLYLYAMFSLKRTEDEGVSTEELAAIHRWRKSILSVALEEMTHLTLVSNLLSSMGGGPNFMRPNFPSSPGYYPSDIVIELAGFDMNTLDHFIYLERPRTEELADGASFDHSRQYTRQSDKGRLMPSSGDYDTVGSLYLSIKEGIEDLSEKFGEKSLFFGSKDQQIGPLDSALPGLSLITSKAEALAAIDTIITQGEGATAVHNSHFQRFCAIREEYRELLRRNPDFKPARDVARNPVMRKPIDPQHRVWVTDDLSAQFMDLANALYALMLRTLVQIYAVEHRPRESKTTLVQASMTMMHAMAAVAETLTYLPATREDSAQQAGMSFAMVRFLTPLQADAEKQLMSERTREFLEVLTRLKAEVESSPKSSSHIHACLKQLKVTEDSIRAVQAQLMVMPDVRLMQAAPPSPPVETVVKPSITLPDDPGTEVSETDAIRLTFNMKRCIHSRHCVTELPKVFKANTPGEWIFAGNTHPEILAAVARECPSGAIQYTRKDGGPQELRPDVNMMRTRENGPYAFLGELKVDGKEIGMRATLCRCGQSQNKPFCDGAHNAAKFKASGNPALMDDTSLSSRNGPVTIDRLQDGPLSVQGNVEICAGTGHVVLRTSKVKLCRCGHSNNKPLCDGSHVEAGFRDNV